MAAKPKLSVKHFRGAYALGHQKRVLKRVGTNPEHFARMKPKEQRQTLAKVVSTRPKHGTTRKATGGDGGGTASVIAPRSAKTIRKEGRAAAELEFGPSIRQKKAEIAGSNIFQSQTLPSYYDKYRQDVAAAAQRTQAAYGQAIQGQTDANKDVQNQYGQDQARRQAEAQKMAKITGTAPTAPKEADQASMQRGRQAQDFSALLGQRQAGAASTFGQLGAAGRQREIQSVEGERRNQKKTQADLSDLRRQRGAFKVDFKRKSRDEERTFAEEAKAFNLKVETEGQSEADKAASRKLQRRQQNLSHRDRQRTASREEKKDAYQRAHHTGPYKPGGAKGGKGGETLPQQRARHKAHAVAKQDLDRATRIATGQIPAKDQSKVPSGLAKRGNGQKLTNWLISKNLPPDLARVAAFRAIFPHAKLKSAPKTRKAWNNYIESLLGS